MNESPIKWMGSKQKLLPKILDRIPKNYNTYIEPFFGSGAVFFALKPKKALCSDVQHEPIIICNSIKKKPKLFHEYYSEYVEILWEKGKDYYYYLRDEYNNNNYKYTEVEMAATFMLLLRSGFNGLVRFNKKGHWNVPFGDRGHKHSKSQANKLHIEYDRVIKYNQLLSEGEKNFKVQDFHSSISEAGKGDFIYCDPPYIETTQKYNGWNYDNEMELKNALSAAVKNGAKFILSNVYEYKGVVNEKLLDLYSNYNYEIIDHNYVIGPNKERRQNVKEILIFNSKI